jgi:hypothetical protein
MEEFIVARKGENEFAETIQIGRYSTAVDAVNAAARDMFRFLGFDDYRLHLSCGNGSVGVYSVTCGGVSVGTNYYIVKVKN